MSDKMTFIGHSLPMSNEHIIDRSNPLWEHPDFPSFYWNPHTLEPQETEFTHSSQSLQHQTSGSEDLLKVEEVYYNSIIEGVELDKQSLRSSLKKNLTLQRPKDKEEGAVKLMELAIAHKADRLSHELIQEMNTVVLMHHDNENIRKKAGMYVGDMLVIKGGRIDQTVIEDKGVPKERVHEEMSKFITWFNERPPNTPMINAIRGHLHFEKIHPFADGNGRVGRALMNMSLMSDLKLSIPLALSKAIQRHSKIYYQSFALQSLDLTETIQNLSPIIYLAVEETKKILALTVLRKKVYTSDLNERQRKALEKVITIEIEDRFQGKLTNQKYRKIVGGIDIKMAQRDLGHLVDQNILLKLGERKGTHYVLNLGDDCKWSWSR